jgi:glycosyltransferase involved in cell wall biosynthesis
LNATFDSQARLTAALADHHAGRLEAAAAGYRAALAWNPTDPNALHLLGVAERAMGRGVAGLFLIARAGTVAPQLPGLDVNLENATSSALIELAGQTSAEGMAWASARLSTLSALMPNNVSVLRNLGALRLIMGDEDGARRINDAAVRLDPAAADKSALAIALDGLEIRRRDYGFAGTVVIPAYNARDYIVQALDSVVASVNYARANGAGENFQVHVNVVDDRSPDDTPDVVRDWARAHPEQSVTLLFNNRNRGAGGARNLGAAAAYGRYLWFLDADDRFLEPHLVVTAACLDASPHVGYVRTGIEFDVIDDKISEEWRRASEFTYPCSMAVRRECHDFIGGFPDEKPFGPAGPEDVAYARSLGSMFLCAKTPRKTVFYTMRPGNILEKLHKDMISGGKSPDGFKNPESSYVAVEILIRRRLHALERRRGDPDWKGPPLSPDSQTRVVFF